MARISTLFALALGTLAVAGACSTARAKTTCLGSKLQAIAKKETSKLACHAKVAQKSDPSTLDACLAKAEAKFTKAFLKAEAAGQCSGVAATCECLVDRCVSAIRKQLPDAGKCEAARLNATAKKVKSILGCNAKAAAMNLAVDADCVQKAKDKFAHAFAKAAGCSGDPSVVEGLVDSHCIARTGADPAGGAMVGALCDTGTPGPSCPNEGGRCGNCGAGICVTACGCGSTGLVCLNNGTFDASSGCASDADCASGKMCVANLGGGGSCGSGTLNGCADPCP
jgi:hypothetical protein